MVLALNELMILKRKVNAHLDRSDLHSDKLATILSILQQIEAKQDLLFNNAPPAPGEAPIPTLYTPCKEDAPDGHTWHNHLPEPIPGHYTHSNVTISHPMPKEVLDYIEKKLKEEEDVALNGTKLQQHFAKLSSMVPTKKKANVVAKKKGRPKKAPKD